MSYEIQNLKREVDHLELEIHRKANNEELNRAFRRIEQLEGESTYHRTQIDELKTTVEALRQIIDTLFELTGHDPGHL